MDQSRIFDACATLHTGGYIDLPCACTLDRLGHVERRKTTSKHPWTAPYAILKQRPVKGQAIATGKVRAFGRLRIDEQLISDTGIRIKLGQVSALPHPDGLHHRQTEAGFYFSDAFNAFAAVKLEHVERNSGGERVEHLIVGVDGKGDLTDPHRDKLSKGRSIRDFQMTRGFREEHKAHVARTGLGRSGNVRSIAQAANLYRNIIGHFGLAGFVQQSHHFVFTFMLLRLELIQFTLEAAHFAGLFGRLRTLAEFANPFPDEADQ